MHGLHLPLGVSCTDINVLRDEAVNFMKNLLCEKMVLPAPSYEHNVCKVNFDERISLLK